MPLRISMLGPPRVWWRPAPVSDDAEHEITSAFQPRLRKLLVFLGLHPDGAGREALIAALWATSPPERTTNAMNTGLSRPRRALTTATGGALSDVVLVGEGRFRLDPDLVEVDYWSFGAAVTARRTAATDHQRIEAHRRIVDSYLGPLADGMSTDWIETAREAIRRDAIDAVAALAGALVEHAPQQTLDLLEIARTFDPHNELIYRDIMRLQERLGQLDAIPRTLTLLATRLAEVDDRPLRRRSAWPSGCATATTPSPMFLTCQRPTDAAQQGRSMDPTSAAPTGNVRGPMGCRCRGHHGRTRDEFHHRHLRELSAGGRAVSRRGPTARTGGELRRRRLDAAAPPRRVNEHLTSERLPRGQIRGEGKPSESSFYGAREPSSGGKWTRLLIPRRCRGP
ncbi:BTAD domain-containing putative transcriptional regulator [Actinosynnema sp. NPDC023794]